MNGCQRINRQGMDWRNVVIVTPTSTGTVPPSCGGCAGRRLALYCRRQHALLRRDLQVRHVHVATQINESPGNDVIFVRRLSACAEITISHPLSHRRGGFFLCAVQSELTLRIDGSFCGFFIETTRVWNDELFLFLIEEGRIWKRLQLSGVSSGFSSRKLSKKKAL